MATIPKRSSISELGRLVMNWNDLEVQIRVLLLKLTNDVTSAEILAAKLEAPAIFEAVRALANEYDANRKRLNTRLAMEADTHNTKVRFYEEVSSHVNHVIDCAGYLREYKEFYLREVRGTSKLVRAPIVNFKVPDCPANYSQLTTPPELERVATQLKNLAKYTAAIIACIAKNENKRARARLVWPKKLSLA